MFSSCQWSPSCVSSGQTDTFFPTYFFFPKWGVTLGLFLCSPLRYYIVLWAFIDLSSAERAAIQQSNCCPVKEVRVPKYNRMFFFLFAGSLWCFFSHRWIKTAAPLNHSSCLCLWPITGLNRVSFMKHHSRQALSGAQVHSHSLFFFFLIDTANICHLFLWRLLSFYGCRLPQPVAKNSFLQTSHQNTCKAVYCCYNTAVIKKVLQPESDCGYKRYVKTDLISLHLLWGGIHGCHG